MKKVHPLLLSITGGLLLWAAWPVSPLTFLIFIAFLPLLYLADNIARRNVFLLYTFITLLVWNAATTWWIWNAAAIPSIAAIVANSLLMCLPWWFYHSFKQKYSSRPAYIALISCWMLFEYLHLNWQLSWPWLSVGNVFAQRTGWIQWYEYTGIAGGTLWVLLVNVLLKSMIDTFKQPGYVKNVIGFVAVLAIPFIVSFLIHPFDLIKGIRHADNIVIVQPNVDPYGKFESQNINSQIATLVSQSEKEADTATRLVVWPETALAANVPVEQITTAPVYQPVMDFLNRHPNITLLTGVETYKILGTERTTPSARKTDNGLYYDSYNAAIVLKSGQPMQLYVKSRLVPGVETMPTFLNFLGPLFEQFGGTSGGYARDTASMAFHVAGNPYVATPIICYESIYGEYVSTAVAKGANVIAIITNDGWWGNTPGHKQHLAYASLRAIETRKYVVRSANTGISAVIDRYGRVKEKQPWDKLATIKYTVPIHEGKTFYVKNGDYLYVIGAVTAALFIAWHWLVLLRRRFGYVRR